MTYTMGIAYEKGFQAGYAQALDDAQRIRTEWRVNGSDFVACLDKLRVDKGIEVEPRLGVGIFTTQQRGLLG